MPIQIIFDTEIENETDTQWTVINKKLTDCKIDNETYFSDLTIKIFKKYCHTKNY